MINNEGVRTVANKQNRDSDNVPEEKPKKGSWLNWLLWWRIDRQEVLEQAKNNKLGIFNSFRGGSLLLIIFSAAMTLVGIGFDVASYYSLIEAGVFILLGVFIYRGHKWAMVLVMIGWTLGKIFQIISGGGFVTILFWWAFYMHAFYSAYHVEILRDSIRLSR